MCTFVFVVLARHVLVVSCVRRLIHVQQAVHEHDVGAEVTARHRPAVHRQSDLLVVQRNTRKHSTHTQDVVHKALACYGVVPHVLSALVHLAINRHWPMQAAHDCAIQDHIVVVQVLERVVLDAVVVVCPTQWALVRTPLCATHRATLIEHRHSGPVAGHSKHISY